MAASQVTEGSLPECPGEVTKVLKVMPPRFAIPSGIDRPLWSVMIPTFNCAKYLRETLASVLAQALDVSQMQIEVVDDFSTKDDPEAVVKEIGAGRVSFFKKPKNEGAISNFNTCIERSRGHLIHILHGDDYVLPGFYARLSNRAGQHNNVSIFCTRSQVVDEAGSLDHISGRIPHLTQPSRLVGDLLYANSLLTPAVVVRRQFYETHGGFLPELVHVADWEMWIRAISQGGGLWLNELLAAYRFFPGNDTGRLARTAQNLQDYLRLGDILAGHFEEFDATRFRAMVAQKALQQELLFRSKGDFEAARFNGDLWCQLARTSDRSLFAWRSKLKLLRRQLSRDFR